MSEAPTTELVASVINSPVQEVDRLPNRVIVIGLMLVLLVVVAGTVICVLMGKDVPDNLSQIAMMIITGVAGFYTGQAISQKSR